ncbi:hypothetical protein PENSTE_c001G03634 [Penicillium steckii]|uniref:Uncharacterized protein n=1 Tax=Penicillium steckii TaxID=303698 RepID=A0A1V6U1P2_9EURO|nr:hypothetical protein PENSTE_c001G03634 [Penicillium steckii]
MSDTKIGFLIASRPDADTASPTRSSPNASPREQSIFLPYFNTNLLLPQRDANRDTQSIWDHLIQKIGWVN